MLPKKKVSTAVIRRLPKYYRHLQSLLIKDINKISSEQLSKVTGFTASQIRQDLNCFGGFGQQGYGYNVEHLYKEISKILGIDKKKYMIIVGAGNLGQALAKYSNFENKGFRLVGIFDKDKDVIGRKVNDLEVLDINDLSKFLKNNEINLAILSVSSNSAVDTAKFLVQNGIKAILNFCAIDLDMEEDTVVEDVHLVDSLMTLSYRLEKEGK